MSKTLIVKNEVLGQGIPLICVPITKTGEEEILAEAQRIVDAGIRMIEWRADYLTQITDTNVIREILLKLQEICKEAVLLVTVRTTTQGGKAKLDEKQMKKLLTVIATSHAADLIDVEYYFFKEPPTELISQIQQEGALVIASHHNFQKTPSMIEMESMLLGMEDGGANIVKLAVMPRNVADVFRLGEAVSTYAAHEDTPIIAMSMGKLGTITRVSGELFGSCVTFGTLGEESAPGQIPVSELTEVMATLHRYSGSQGERHA